MTFWRHTYEKQEQKDRSLEIGKKENNLFSFFFPPWLQKREVGTNKLCNTGASLGGGGTAVPPEDSFLSCGTTGRAKGETGSTPTPGQMTKPFMGQKGRCRPLLAGWKTASETRPASPQPLTAPQVSPRRQGTDLIDHPQGQASS